MMEPHILAIGMVIAASVLAMMTLAVAVFCIPIPKERSGHDPHSTQLDLHSPVPDQCRGDSLRHLGEPDMSGKDYDKDARTPPDPQQDKAAQDAAKDAFRQEKQDQIKDNADKGKDK